MSVAVAAPHPAAVDAARTVVAAGGNAFDAALAAAAALAVVYPHQCSAGGDLVAMVRPAGRPVQAILSIGAAAAAVDVSALRAAGPGMPLHGPQTVTVPGVVAGWGALHVDARLPLAALLGPAVRLAADGVPFSPGLRAAIDAGKDRIVADPGLAAVMLRPTLVQPALAATLGRIGSDWRSFYADPPLAKGLRAVGSPLSVADFAAHAAEVVAPLTAASGGVTWHAAPAPVQGATFLAVVGSSSLLTDSRRAQADRDARLGDPRRGPLSAGPVRTSGPEPKGDTVAVTAVDDDGNAVALIQSVFESFGAGLLDPDTGIVLHNRGSAFSLDPDHPACIGPGLRPPHTLCPTIGTTAAGDVIALGCQGGRAQPWILAQVAPEALTAADPSALVARPRWILRGDELILEPGVTLSAPGDLTVSTTEGPHHDAGHVQIARLRGTLLDAGSDPRADGLAAVLS